MTAIQFFVSDIELELDVVVAQSDLHHIYFEVWPNFYNSIFS